MDLVIFIVGFLVTMSVIYGIFAQVPLQISEVENPASESTEE